MDKNLLNLELRLDWSEMDLYEHINNVSYFKYLQAGRVNCWEITGLLRMLRTHSFGPTLATTTYRFLKPLRYPGKIQVTTEITFVKKTSFGLKHLIKNDSGELCAEGEDVIVFFNYKLNTKEELPDEFKILLQSLKI